MGFLDLLQGNRIYLDANIWIYALEGVADYLQVQILLFESVDAGSLTIVTSELSRAEILATTLHIKKTGAFGTSLVRCQWSAFLFYCCRTYHIENTFRCVLHHICLITQ